VLGRSLGVGPIGHVAGYMAGDAVMQGVGRSLTPAGANVVKMSWMVEQVPRIQKGLDSLASARPHLEAGGKAAGQMALVGINKVMGVEEYIDTTTAIASLDLKTLERIVPQDVQQQLDPQTIQFMMGLVGYIKKATNNLQPGQKPMATLKDRAEFSLRFYAAMDPSTAMRSLAAGDPKVGQFEALSAVHGAVWGPMRNEFVANFNANMARGAKYSERQLRSYSIAMYQQAPTMVPSLFNSIQGASTVASPQGGGSPAPKPMNITVGDSFSDGRRLKR